VEEVQVCKLEFAILCKIVRTYFDWGKIARRLTIINGYLFGLVFWSAPPSLYVGVCYLCLFAASATAGWVIGSRWPRWQRRWFQAGWLLGFVLCYVNFSCATYVERERTDAGLLVITTKTRGGHRPVYKRIYSDVAHVDDAWLAMEGGYSESGRPHGKWETVTFLRGADTTVKDEWFWYGEEISEGEWHLRNR